MQTVTSPPLEGAGGMFNLQTFSYILTVTSPPVLMLVYPDRHISPFEGSPRAGAAEYVHRGGCLIYNAIKEPSKSCRKNINIFLNNQKNNNYRFFSTSISTAIMMSTTPANRFTVSDSCLNTQMLIATATIGSTTPTMAVGVEPIICIA